MTLQGLVKCSRLFLVVFMMCPKRIRLSAPIGTQQEYYHAVRRSLNEVNDPSEMKFIPAQWSADIIKPSEGEPLTSVDDEPGFDLNDDEIRKFKIWPKGIIPYYIDVLSFNDKVLRDRIRLFLNVVNSVTRVSFMEMPSPPKDERTRWVFFVNRRGQLGCADHSIKNFTNDGVQQVILGYDCMSTGGELAEAVLAIAGVPPQHNSPERDLYIKIIEENIAPDKRYLFEKLKPDEWLFYNIKYDFASAGHYHYHKYSVNGRATIETQKSYTGISMGETNGFTFSDIMKLRMLYNYIVKKKEDKVPECDKLFKKSRNSKNILPRRPNPKPRKKPNQYLGLPEEVQHETTKDNEEVTEKYESDKEKNVPAGEDKEETGNEESLSDAPVTSKLNLKSNPLMKVKPLEFFNDPLQFLSDYQTGDEARRRVGRKNKLKVNK